MVTPVLLVKCSPVTRTITSGGGGDGGGVGQASDHSSRLRFYICKCVKALDFFLRTISSRVCADTNLRYLREVATFPSVIAATKTGMLSQNMITS